ncbi:lipoprotein [Latilactobacillus graminis DSM 20719]|uniref:Lipoprotein n=2 Tax=Latilactobacillus graminis TaxID=60519 RepID=A0AA89I1N5_9LACO|nr:lipoprotein [Latilactobacillus graminis DSM 20719]
MVLAGCQNKTTVPPAAIKTEHKIDQYVQKVNQLYRDSAHQKPAQLTATKQQQIITTATRLEQQIKPNLYMSGITGDAKTDYHAAQKDLAKITGNSSTTSESDKPTTQKQPKSKIKTSAFFDKNGIVKANAQLGKASDYTGHPKQLADYQEAQNQLAAMTAVGNLFTDDNFNNIPATLSANDFPYARSLVNKATHSGFKTKYLAYIQNAENQFNTYSANTQASTSQGDVSSNSQTITDTETTTETNSTTNNVSTDTDQTSTNALS